MKPSYVFSGALLAATSYAQQSAYGQCGGQGWTGPTTCVSGYYCSYGNDWYSQCVPGTASSNPTTTAKTTTSTAKATTTAKTATTLVTSVKPTTTSSSLGWKWLGVSESVAEFGSGSYPGTYNKDFTFASTDTIDTLMGQGYNIFRFAFAMERMAPSGISATLGAAYLANYTVAVEHVTAKGGYAVLDPHNFGRYNGAIITDTAAFQTFWANLATHFKDNSNVIFDTNNEYHDMDISLVISLNQAAINGIRGVGATSQYIFAEGNSYSSALLWPTQSDGLKALTDPSNKVIYEMHLYLDSDSSGTSDQCVSSTIGVERVTAATAWLKANGKLGIIGETAGGANTQCETAITGLLTHLKANSDVWTGALWWAAGPWWGTYIYSFEPPSGTGYLAYNSILKTFLP